jgi:hypothetical protein
LTHLRQQACRSVSGRDRTTSRPWRPVRTSWAMPAALLRSVGYRQRVMRRAPAHPGRQAKADSRPARRHRAPCRPRSRTHQERAHRRDFGGDLRQSAMPGTVRPTRVDTSCSARPQERRLSAPGADRSIGPVVGSCSPSGRTPRLTDRADVGIRHHLARVDGSKAPPARASRRRHQGAPRLGFKPLSQRLFDCSGFGCIASCRQSRTNPDCRRGRTAVGDDHPDLVTVPSVPRHRRPARLYRGRCRPSPARCGRWPACRERSTPPRACLPCGCGRRRGRAAADGGQGRCRAGLAGSTTGAGLW